MPTTCPECGAVLSEDTSCQTIKVAWSMTIADVASNYHDAGSYCEFVKQWAQSTLDEMKPLVSSRKR